MKLLHLADLHIGKRINEFSMLEDQRHILAQILDLVQREAPQLVVIAGDVYDKPVPPAEAVQVFDEFLTALAERAQVALIGGNHDSQERLAFGAGLMTDRGVHIAPPYDGALRRFSLTDSRGPVWVWLLPFVRPAAVRPYGENPVDSYTAAVGEALGREEIDFSARNVLVAHQFVTGAVRSDSEEVSVGGLDNVDAGVFEGFDYVALGHIHRSQKMGGEHIRYSGTPLKYSFSEVGHKKSVTVVQLEEKGDLSVETHPLSPLRDMREIKGPFAALSDPLVCPRTEDYLHVTLTDEEEVVDAVAKLRLLYPNLMRLDYDNSRTRALDLPPKAEEGRGPAQLFEDFYQSQNGRAMGDEQRAFAAGIIEELWGNPS